MGEPVAYAVYSDDDNDIYEVALMSEDEVQAVRNEEHEEVGSNKCIIILKDGFKTENHT